MELSQPAYLRYESGERTPSIHVIKVMAEVLNTSVAYLIDETNISTPNSYTIKSDAEPELFQFVEKYRTLDNNTKNRLHTYIQKLDVT